MELLIVHESASIIIREQKAKSAKNRQINASSLAGYHKQ